MESVKEQVPIIKEELPDGQTTLCGAGVVLDPNLFLEFVSKKQIPIIKEELPDGQTTLCGAGDVLDPNLFLEFVSKKQIPIIKEELPDKRTMCGGGEVLNSKVFAKNTHLEANAARSEKESSYRSAQTLCEICGKKFISAEATKIHVTVHTGGTTDMKSSDGDEESISTHLLKSSSGSAVNPAKKLDRGRPLTRSPISYCQRIKRKCPVCYRDYGTHLVRHFKRFHPDINPNMYRHHRGDGNSGRERMVGCKICRKNLNLSSFPRHFRRVHKDIEAIVGSPEYKASKGPAIYST